MHWKTVAAIGALSLLPAAAPEPELRAGTWQNTTLIAGEKPIVASECEPARSLADAATTGLSTDTGCVWQRRTISGGTIDVAGTCPMSGGRQVVSMQGSYTATTLSLTTTTQLAGRSVTLRTTGKWVGTCNADAD